METNESLKRDNLDTNLSLSVNNKSGETSTIRIYSFFIQKTYCVCHATRVIETDLTI